MNFPVSIMSMKSHLISTLSEFVSFQIQAGFIFLLNNEATVRLDDFEIGTAAIARKWYSCAERKKY